MLNLPKIAHILILCLVILNVKTNTKRPNIVLIVADDLGWDDVSHHGSDLTLTPNIDMLAYSGLVIERYYTHCVCTPSRAALLTGKFAHTTGMHGYPLTNGEDRGLPITEKILPQYLKELEYSTHLVGKWHLGQSRTHYLPTSRGFDTHFGFRGGYVDYYEYFNEENWNIGRVSGLDFFRNLTADWDTEGYITDVFTDEAKSIIARHDTRIPLFLMLAHSAPHAGSDGAVLQAPVETIRSLRYIQSVSRRMYSAMVKKLDDSVGEIVEALADKSLLDDTIIIFISDNGGEFTTNFASNWPLKGMKFSPYEGGIRTTGIIWTKSFVKMSHHIWKGRMHVVDWLPTILKAVNASTLTNIDGEELWTSMISGQQSKRREFFEIYTYGDTSFNSIISGDYKLVTGNVAMVRSERRGGDANGIIGCEPQYTESINKSKVLSVFKRNGYPFNIDSVELRNVLRINCPIVTKNCKMPCNALNGTICLYDITNDPCETEELSHKYPDVVSRLQASLQEEMSRTIPRVPLFRDPQALPSLHNYTWATWASEL